MANDAHLRTDDSSDSETANDTSSESSSGSEHDSSDDSEAEPEPGPQRRKHLRSKANFYNGWLHAGLYKNARGEIKDVWYAFKRNKLKRYNIIYASDWMGTPFGNFDVGRRKSDLITWDKHHSEKWSRFVTPRGTWVCRRAMVGRAVQRDSLLQTWLDPNSPNLHHHGKNRDRILGPPLNVIQTIDDCSRTGRVSRAEQMAEAQPEPGLEECYPGTAIPFSSIKIIVEAYKDYDRDPLTIIADFLTGQLARHPEFKRQRTTRNDQIESAFYDCGWRINRIALDKTNDKILLGSIENAFQSQDWRLEPPLWVDRFKGEKLNTVINQMRDDMEEHQDSNESSDYSTGVSTSPERNPESNAGNRRGKDRDGTARNVAGPSNSKPKTSLSKKPSRESRPSIATKRLFESIHKRQDDDSAEEELDYLPESSKAKGKSRAVKKVKRVRKQIAEVSSDEEDDVEEEREEQEKASVEKLHPSPPPTKPFRSAVICIDSPDEDSDIEILEDLSTPVRVKAEGVPDASRSTNAYTSRH